MQARLGQRAAALAQCSEASALLNEIPADSNIGWQNSMRGDLYIHLAQAYVALAAPGGVAPTEQREHWRAARDMYGRSLEIWQDMQKRRILTGEDAAKPEEVARAIARADEFLRKLSVATAG